MKETELKTMADLNECGLRPLEFRHGLRSVTRGQRPQAPHLDKSLVKTKLRELLLLGLLHCTRVLQCDTQDVSSHGETEPARSLDLSQTLSQSRKTRQLLLLLQHVLRLAARPWIETCVALTSKIGIATVILL